MFLIHLILLSFSLGVFLYLFTSTLLGLSLFIFQKLLGKIKFSFLSHFFDFPISRPLRRLFFPRVVLIFSVFQNLIIIIIKRSNKSHPFLTDHINPLRKRSYRFHPYLLPKSQRLVIKEVFNSSIHSSSPFFSKKHSFSNRKNMSVPPCLRECSWTYNRDSNSSSDEENNPQNFFGFFPILIPRPKARRGSIILFYSEELKDCRMFWH